ncbi:MAG: MBL fold metallo-hydrolase [Candidatus Thorarchaeota archaeon]|jgi:L-ascorbate metabolism protein UlaG (beta-lactamase superfamily)
MSSGYPIYLIIMTISIRWLGHASFQINVDEKVIYVDLYRSKKLKERVPDVLDPATLVLATHSHNDHCFPEAIKEVRNSDTTVIAPADCGEKLGTAFTSLAPGEETTVQGIKIKAVHAYNLKRFRTPGNPYHPKGFGVGYLISAENKTVYFAGDTDVIPEMKELGSVDVALLPCGDTYTMDNKDAAEATSIIKPKVVVPMHTWDKSIDDFKKQVENETDAEFRPLKEGESFSI